MRSDTLARSLGFFSIGLGAAEILIPGGLAKFLGINKSNKRLLQGMGMRECANGMGILSDSSNANLLWARVAGDALDLALLGSALINSRKKLNVGIAIANVAAITALDVLCAIRLGQKEDENVQHSFVPSIERSQVPVSG